jgi:hypothetical protein
MTVSLSELTTVRIVCKCGVVIEMASEKFIAGNDLNCPFCCQKTNCELLVNLAKAITYMPMVNGVKIEFVVADR